MVSMGCIKVRATDCCEDAPVLRGEMAHGPRVELHDGPWMKRTAAEKGCIEIMPGWSWERVLNCSRRVSAPPNDVKIHQKFTAAVEGSSSR
jgi:hypothetical protein